LAAFDQADAADITAEIAGQSIEIVRADAHRADPVIVPGEPMYAFTGLEVPDERVDNNTLGAMASWRADRASPAMSGMLCAQISAVKRQMDGCR
jgi:hypothetical protein